MMKSMTDKDLLIIAHEFAELHLRGALMGAASRTIAEIIIEAFVSGWISRDCFDKPNPHIAMIKQDKLS
jgi:hypothetical protein